MTLGSRSASVVGSVALGAVLVPLSVVDIRDPGSAGLAGRASLLVVSALMVLTVVSATAYAALHRNSPVELLKWLRSDAFTTAVGFVAMLTTGLVTLGVVADLDPDQTLLSVGVIAPLLAGRRGLRIAYSSLPGKGEVKDPDRRRSARVARATVGLRSYDRSQLFLPTLQAVLVVFTLPSVYGAAVTGATDDPPQWLLAAPVPLMLAASTLIWGQIVRARAGARLVEHLKGYSYR